MAWSDSVELLTVATEIALPMTQPSSTRLNHYHDCC